MEWTGGCLCGAIRYRASEDPEWIGACHCGQCRKHSGAPYAVAVLFPRGAFEWTTDEPARYASSETVRRGFCPRCGSSLTWEATRGGFMVLMGSLDYPERLRPDSHSFVTSKLPWVEIEEETPRFPAGDTSREWREE